MEYQAAHPRAQIVESIVGSVYDWSEYVRTSTTVIVDSRTLLARAAAVFDEARSSPITGRSVWQQVSTWHVSCDQVSGIILFTFNHLVELRRDFRKGSSYSERSRKLDIKQIAKLIRFIHQPPVHHRIS